MLKPRTEVPEITVEVVNGDAWSLSGSDAEFMTMVVFYRGYHCPICKTYLQNLESNLDKFEALGVKTIAISSNNQEIAEKTKQEWALERLPLGYNLSIEKARELGLYVSEGINENEPEIFSEPGLYLVKADGSLYAAAIQTMPFTRPNFDELLGALKFVKAKNYPARGEA
ncbi:peroxiredoxin-like family protein [Pontibacter oryzae]|uniref:AhpC/TSA family protein n=1 Tax=Pontibacter oryzae TaxID=2304593 RepID=A0A399SKU1_9BACT|nr:peroxiredoxin-like family protein [Pontibacter oryzae]RIJ42385.1 AhpC/TSA family protein [Pontibacter oryzae]